MLRSGRGILRDSWEITYRLKSCSMRVSAVDISAGCGQLEGVTDFRPPGLDHLVLHKGNQGHHCASPFPTRVSITLKDDAPVAPA